MCLFSQRTLWFILALVATALHAAIGQNDFEKWKKDEEKKYQSFVEERDKEFVSFLKREWKQMQLLEGLVPDEKPKPVQIPIYTPPPMAGSKDTMSEKRAVILPQPAPVKESPSHRTEKPAIDQQRNAVTAKTTFFGTPLAFNYDQEFKISVKSPINNETIGRFWESLSAANHRDLLKQALYFKDNLNLNDWGYLKLLHAMGMEIYHAENEAILLTWFLSSKSGYETRVGFSGNQVCLLTPTNNTLYNVPFFTFADKARRYYALQLDRKWKLADERIFTYEVSYPEATRLVEFSIQSPPTMPRSSAAKILKFSYAGQEYSIPVRFSANAVRFFEDYPQTNFEVYFAASPSTEATASLLAALQPLVKGKTEQEAVSFLLRFVQTAFVYKTDPEQFGREKPLFPDETLFYDYSDCEDRAILFSYLVKSLCGLDVIGLDYPAHIATAVKFTDNIPGDAVIYQGKKYLICDPTYTNADAGVCMPNLKSVEPKVIHIASRQLIGSH